MFAHTWSIFKNIKDRFTKIEINNEWKVDYLENNTSGIQHILFP